MENALQQQIIQDLAANLQRKLDDKILDAIPLDKMSRFDEMKIIQHKGMSHLYLDKVCFCSWSTLPIMPNINIYSDTSKEYKMTAEFKFIKYKQ